jgi:hypothetical protein
VKRYWLYWSCDVTNNMQQIFSLEANSSAGGKEIPPHLVEYEDLLPFSQQPVTCPYPEPDQSIRPHPLPSYFFKIYLILTSHLLLELPSDLFPSCFPSTPYMAFSSPSARATYPAHLVLLDFFTRHMCTVRNAIAEGSQCSYRTYL